MKRLVLIAAAAASLAACATTESADAASPAAPGDSEACDVTVVFGSYAMGIDGDTFAKVEAYLAERKDVVSQAQTTSWGREGERTICIDAKTDAAAKKIYADLEAMAPKTANRGPITLKSRFGDGFQSKPPASMR